MRSVALLLLTTTACATVSKPLSATRAAEVRTREAILTHLAQSQASGELCDARLSRDLLADASLQDAIIDAWVDGTISHAVFADASSSRSRPSTPASVRDSSTRWCRSTSAS